MTMLDSSTARARYTDPVGNDKAGGRRPGRPPKAPLRPPLYDGLLRAGVEWPVIHSATGIDEPTYRTLKRDAANGTEQTAPRQ